jgi:hypothetical protein
MDHQQQIEAFATDIQKVIDRYRAEFSITMAAAVGVLEIIKMELYFTSEEK